MQSPTFPEVPIWKTRIANIGMIFFGLIMMVTPLALWVAPTKPWFYFVLEAFAISSVMVCFFARFETTADEHRKSQQANPDKASLADKCVEQLQNLGILQRSRPVQIDLQELVKKHRTEIRAQRED